MQAQGGGRDPPSEAPKLPQRSRWCREQGPQLRPHGPSRKPPSPGSGVQTGWVSGLSLSQSPKTWSLRSGAWQRPAAGLGAGGPVLLGRGPSQYPARQRPRSPSPREAASMCRGRAGGRLWRRDLGQSRPSFAEFHPLSCTGPGKTCCRMGFRRGRCMAGNPNFRHT